MGEVTMPRLSDTMSEGTVGRWLKKPGDQIAVGEIIAEIETDKATMELEAFEGGTLQKIVVGEGEMVPVGQQIAIIGDGPVEEQEAPAAAAPPTAAAQTPTEEGAAEAEAGAAEAEARTTKGAEASTSGAPDTGTGTAQGYNDPTTEVARAPGAEPETDDATNGQRIMASPVARRLAEEYGIDLHKVKGTGPGGRIIKENIEEFRSQQGSQPAAKEPAAAPAEAKAPAPAPAPAEAKAPAPAPAAAPAPAVAGEFQPLGRMRKAIARAMNSAKPGTPHIYVTVEVDMGAAMALRKQLNDSGAAPVKISVNDFVVKASALALRKFPNVNASYTEQNGQPGVVHHPAINVSVAVALDDGLTAPVVFDTDKKGLGTIAAEVKDLAGRAREGKLKQNELEGATFQVTNLGMFDVIEFDSIITTPQAASLAVGAVRSIPVVRDGQVAIGEIMSVTLSADHRIVDGAVAAQYLQELKRLLQTPMSVLV